MDVPQLQPTFFGPEFDGHPCRVLAEELKTMNLTQRIRPFKARTDDYLISQTDLLTTTTIWTPFPLAIMTCVGIELLGSYKYGYPGNNSNRHFQRLVEDIDPAFAGSRPNPDGATEPLSDFIYRAFRHSLVHGFRGKWVFITDRSDEAEKWVYGKSERALVINIYWFYAEFKRVYKDYFQSLMAATKEKLDPLKTFKRTFERHFAYWLP